MGDKMNANARIAPARHPPRSTMPPDFVVGLGWFGFLLLALRVRLVEPVFLWVLTQALLVEKMSHGFWSSRTILLGFYMGAALAVWWLIERKGRNPRHAWRRALLAWLGIQTAYGLTATFLVQAGILYD